VPVETKLSAWVPPVKVPAVPVLSDTWMALVLVAPAARLLMLPEELNPVAGAPRVTLRPSVKASGGLVVMLIPAGGLVSPTRAARVTVPVFTRGLAVRYTVPFTLTVCGVRLVGVPLLNVPSDWKLTWTLPVRAPATEVFSPTAIVVLLVADELPGAP